ncbi:MAG: hypothetical protein JRF02_01605 [Deltaproteobacteria bacterium]|jgi:hypothetical protein|nr:hypothetical protein [Deltaproteobacteria bacterium]
MKKVFIVLISVFFVCGLFSLAQAGKGNGFPEGEHYNLNLIAKKSNPDENGYFACPDPDSYQWDYYQTIEGKPECTETAGVLDNPENCEKCTLVDLQECPVIIPSEQNVIFVPRENDVVVPYGTPDKDISILIKSGKAKPGKGGKNSGVTYPDLIVTDWCTEHFPNYGDQNETGAVFQLYENRNGYDVYARLTGKPTHDPTWTFMAPTIELVQDEYGNDLYYFGAVGGPEGCVDALGDPMLVRIDDSKGKGNGKGVNKATDLSCLFDFNGDVCYINDLCEYCPPAGSPSTSCSSPIADDNTTLLVPDWPYEWDSVCCLQDVPTVNSLACPSEPIKYDCIPPLGGCIIVGDEKICNWSCADSADPNYLNVLTPLWCYNYSTDTWVFDIADFVDVLWKSKTTGAYVVQLRFYPR